MATLKKYVVAGEYIGKKAAVFSKVDNKLSSQGNIVDETKNTFVIKNNGKKRKIIKENTNFMIDLYNYTCTLLE